MAGKSKLAWGIDVGQCGLRAIKLEAVGSDLLVSDFEIIDYPHSLADLPAASHDQTIREALSKFTSGHNLKGAVVVVGVPGRNSQARFVALPPVEPKKIPQIVEFEARQQIPFDINDVVWDYQAIKLEDSPDVIAGIFFIKRDVVESFLGNFQHAGILTNQVQMSPMALYNALLYDGLTDPQAATVILDVGSVNTEFVVADGQKVFHRTIPIGGNNFTQALAKTFKLSFSKAENLKRKCATSKYAKQVFQAMRSVFSDLSSEIQRSIGFYTTLNRQARLTRMLAVGNTFHLPGLQKYLQQSLKIELIRIDQFSRLSLAPQLSAAAFSAGVLSMGVAYGLALQGLGRANINVNLLPPVIARRQLWRAKKPIFAAAVALLALIIAGIYARNLMDLRVLNGPLDNQGPDAPSAVVKQAQRYQQQLRQAEDQVKKERRSIDDYVVLLAERDVWPAMLRAIIGALDTADDPTNPASEYDKPRSQRRLIFLQNFSSKYSEDLDSDYDKQYDLDKPGPRAALGWSASAATAPEKPKKGFIMEIRCITPFDRDAEYSSTSRFLIAELCDQLPVKAQVEMDQLQARLTELSAKPVRFKFSPLTLHRLDFIEKAAAMPRASAESADNGEQKDKFPDPLRPGESMAKDHFFWIHWKVYIEQDEQETAGPGTAGYARPSGRGAFPRAN